MRAPARRGWPKAARTVVRAAAWTLIALACARPARAAEPSAADKLVAQLEARIPALRIQVRGAPAGVAVVVAVVVAVDGAPIPAVTLNVPRRVNPGTHAIVASAPGYAARQVVTLSEAQVADVT